MLTVHQISKKFNINDVLVDVSFNLNRGDRVGLIGPNGCGKTTLLDIIVGNEVPDRGVITRTPNDLKIGYLQQAFKFQLGETLGEIISRSFGLSQQLENELANMASDLAAEPDQEDLQVAYDSLLSKFATRSSPSIHPQAILEKLGLGGLPEDILTTRSSAGFVIRTRCINPR
jgi:ATP-binding cassette subfamily F protein 3